MRVKLSVYDILGCRRLGLCTVQWSHRSIYYKHTVQKEFKLRYILLIFILTNFLNASVITINNTAKIENFEMQYYLDNNRTLGIEEIAKKNFSLTTPSKFTFGLTGGNVWFKLAIKNTSDSQMILLDMYDPWFEEFSLYTYSQGGWQEDKNGLIMPLNEKKIKDTSPTILLNIPKGEEKTFYLKLYTPLASFGEIVIHKNMNSYMQDRLIFTSTYMVYFGIIFISMLLNLFLFIICREKIYLYYAGFAGSLGFDMSVMSGISGYFITTHYYELNIASVVSMIFFVLFSQELLEVKKHNRYIYTALNILVGILFLIILFSSLDIVFWLNLSSKVFVVALILLAFVATKSLKRGSKTAKIYLIVSIIYFISLVQLMLLFQGLLENNDFNRYAFLYVSFFQFSFFTLMLADKYHRAKTKLLKNVLEHEELLEKQVLARTKELEAAHNALTKLSEQDALTTLYNRRYFEKIAHNNFALAQRGSQIFSILMLDLDHFKNINDTYGHSVGDDVLVGVSKTLLSIARQSDVCVRYGGEEFIVLLPSIDLEEAQIAAERVRKGIKELSFNSDKKESFGVTISIGISQFSPEDKSIDTIVKRADKALYISKDTGRDKFTVISHEASFV